MLSDQPSSIWYLPSMATISAGGVPKRVSARDSQGRMMMRLHFVNGSFFSPDTGAAGGQCAMAAAVWSRMPEDLMWRVVQFVPAAKHFQWHLVSRQWRKTLTSNDFRKQLVATAAARSGRRAAAGGGAAVEQRPVYGYVTAGCSPYIDVESNGGSSSSNDNKVVDIDLSFVPSWFWKSDWYTVMAAVGGLVLISNERVQDSDGLPEDNQYCVINPLTRTCKVLPKVPFSPHVFLRSSRPVAITGFQEHEGRSVNCDDWMMATCDLLEGAGQLQWTLVDGLVPRRLPPFDFETLPSPKFFAVCNGEVVHCYDYELRLISAAAEGGASSTSSVALDWPRFLDLAWLEPASNTCKRNAMFLVAHRGTFFLVSELEQVGSGPAMSCGIWRLVRSRLAWEAVAGLETEELLRLARRKHADAERDGAHDCLFSAERDRAHDRLFGAWGAGDQLCLELALFFSERAVDYWRVMVGCSLETGTWELLYDDWRLTFKGMSLELRPDLFLS